MSDTLTSIRVNSALLPRFSGKNVRLTCRPVKARLHVVQHLAAAERVCTQFMGTTATVAASDGGEVTVTLLPDTHMASDTYYEIIGSALNSTTIKMYHCIPMGANLDMKLVDDTINLMHDPRFYTKMFTSEH
ncbi:hypothetical protein DFH06DRAFT_1301868 [Mycena polygramma]|nr:hypothetical protein DFH06DRAFT_1301868 [Mycena polygramma]